MDLLENEEFIPMDIHSAANLCHVDVVRHVIERSGPLKGRVVDSQNKSGWTSLMYAAHNNKQGVIYLLKEGASTSVQNNKEQTALMLASSYGSLECVTVLVQAGANVDTSDCVGWTALFYAASNGFLEIVQFLLKSKCSINIVDKHAGVSPLMLAAAAGYDLVVSELLQFKADLSICSKEGQTAYSLAVKYQHRKVVEVLSAYSNSAKHSLPIISVSQDEAETVEKILKRLDLSKYYPLFVKHKIDFKSFWTLTDTDLINIGLVLLGPRRKITNAIEKWWQSIHSAHEKQLVIDRVTSEKLFLQKEVHLLEQQFVAETSSLSKDNRKLLELLLKYSTAFRNIENSIMSYSLSEHIQKVQRILDQCEVSHNATHVDNNLMPFIQNTLFSMNHFIIDMKKLISSYNDDVAKLLG